MTIIKTDRGFVEASWATGARAPIMGAGDRNSAKIAEDLCELIRNKLAERGQVAREFDVLFARDEILVQDIELAEGTLADMESRGVIPRRPR